MSPLLRRSLAGSGALVVLLALLGLLLGAASAPALGATVASDAPAGTGVDLPAGLERQPQVQAELQSRPPALAARVDTPVAAPRPDGELWSTFVMAGALVTTGCLFLRGVRRDLRGDLRAPGRRAA